MRRPTPVSVKKKLVFSAAVGISFALLLYTAFTVFRATRVYRYLKSHKQGFDGRLFANDPVLGFAPIPGSSGSEILPLRTRIPVRFDENGFRIPVDAPIRTKVQRPLVLSLGCSFSFGIGCAAEETYPYLVAKNLNGTALNAGVPSYGLVQMLILAEKWIPKAQPDFVLVSYAPWLADRAVFPFPVLQFGFAPSPYFVEGNGSVLSIHPPLFATLMFELPMSHFRNSKATAQEYISFMLIAGFPLYFQHDSQRAKYRIQRAAGTVPQPLADRSEAIRFSYSRIQEICLKYGVRMIVVLLRKPLTEDRVILRSLSDAIIVDAESGLWNRLSEKTERGYAKAYWHRQGSVVLDSQFSE